MQPPLDEIDGNAVFYDSNIVSRSSKAVSQNSKKLTKTDLAAYIKRYNRQIWLEKKGWAN